MIDIINKNCPYCGQIYVATWSYLPSVYVDRDVPMLRCQSDHSWEMQV